MGLFEAKNKFSEVCESVVSTGDPCLITKHGRAFVKLVPADEDTEKSVWDLLKEDRARYGESGEDFELPARRVSANRKSPL
jgi:prevent-host-death family protein